MKKRRRLLLIAASLLVGCAMGSLNEDIRLSSLTQSNRHHEVIDAVQGALDRGEEVSSFRLLLLCAAYYELRQYDKLLATTDLFEKRIAAGDGNYYGGDLTVYPPIFRAGVHLDFAEYDKAIEEASRAYAMLHRDGRDRQMFYRQQMIYTLNALGVAHALLGRREEALKNAEELARIDISQSNLGPDKQAALARIHMANKEFGKALAAVKDPSAQVSADLTQWYNTTFQDLPKLFICAKSQYETGSIDEAKKGYDQLLRHAHIAQAGGIYWPVLLDRARIARAEGEAAKAEMLLKQAVDVIERQRASIDTESGRIGFVGDKQEVYQELVSLLAAAGHDADAFEYVERAKARALVDLLASQKDIAVRTANADRVRLRITELAKAEADLNAFLAPESNQGVEGTRGVVIGIQRDLAVEAPEVASLVAVTNTPMKKIQDLLSPDEALLEYYSTANELFVFVMTREGIRAAKLDRTNLENNIKQFRAAVTNPASDCVPCAQRLSQQLLKPVSDAVGNRKLIIVPHGLLHYVPFDALHSGKEYLIARTSTRLVPSASILQFLKDRKKPTANMLVLGNPDVGDARFDLKFAQDEAQSVAKKMKESKVLLRANATETVVKRDGEQFSVLHFATHGVFDVAAPLDSALLLAKDGENDGLLRVGELYTLRLDADLVTLSACETAMGKVANGDDVVGFTRGLLYAGASSIVSSLWKVDDRATRLLMERFYENWIGGMTKAQALREAKLWLMNHEEEVADPAASLLQGREVKTRKKPFAHPYYWAAFELVGKSG